MIAQGDAGPSRRALLGGLLAGPAAISLAGCGIRLERDAPDVPGLKTQGPPPDREVLLATLRSVQGLLRAAERTPDDASAWLPPVRVAHRAQVTRLVDVLASLGVDAPSAAGSTSPTPTPTGTTSPPSAPAPSTSNVEARSLAQAETRYPAAASEIKAWAASTANRPMLVSLCASRRAAASLLGGSDQPPRGTPPAAVSAIPIARAVRPAVYGFERIAAKTPVRQRAQVSATLRWLSGARTDLGPLVRESERTSYALPVRVTDTASARRLAHALLTDVLAAVASQTGRVGDQGTGAQQWTLDVWSRTAADLARWGGPVGPFPGLRT